MTRCMHGWPRVIEGRKWGCPHHRCMEEAAAAYDEAVRQIARAEAEEAAKTPEDRLVDALRALWAQHPDQRELVAALVEYAAAVKGRAA